MPKLCVRPAAAAIAIALIATALVAHWPSPARASDPARDRACAWVLEPSADRENILFPDTGTRYLGAVAPVPPGGYVEIHGQFPHARYMSLQTYSTTLQSTSDLRDEQIRPDPGSANPFLPGADRNAAQRTYTVRLVAGAPPSSGPAPNTLYDTSADGSKSGHGLAYRIYLPDRSAGPFGGVPAPALTFVSASGQRVPVPTCPDPGTDVGLTQTLAGLGASDYGLPDAGALAYRQPVWHKYVNAPTSYATGVTDNQDLGAAGPPVTGATDQLPSGLGENADNKYIYTYLSQEFGQVVEFRAKLPTTPRTRDGEPTMGTGQLRYWSICTANRTTQSYGCAVDEDVPTDSNGYFTIAISTAADRPANATADCGVVWLPWGPDPKGIAYIRNMLPSADFHQAIQNATPGTEAATLGPYYPTGTYYSTPEDFERGVGCHPPAGAVPGRAPSAAPQTCTSLARVALPARFGVLRGLAVYVDGHRVRAARVVGGRHGSRPAYATLAAPHGRTSFVVRIVGRAQRGGRRLTITRRYAGCRASREQVKLRRG